MAVLMAVTGMIPKLFDALPIFEQFRKALKATFERVIDKAYHTTGNTGIMGDGFGQLTPFEILHTCASY